MRYIIIIAAVLALCTSFAVAKDKKKQSETIEQQPGQQLVFPNVEEVRDRPSDIHIGSDPYYQKGMEQKMKGSDESGYDKNKVEPDQTIYEQNTEYKIIKGK